MLADEILALVFERPGISAEEIRSEIPNVDPNTVRRSIGVLRGEGWIESVARGTYRAVPAVELPPLAHLVMSPQRRKRDSSIAPAPMARLMAGR